MYAFIFLVIVFVVGSAQLWPTPVRAANVTVSGHIFEDQDNNGIEDGSDAGIARVTVRLWVDVDDSGTIDASIDTVADGSTTDDNGDYSFSVPEGDNYLIDVYDANLALGTMKLSTANEPQAISVAASPISGNPIGYRPGLPISGAISSSVRIGEGTTNGPTGLNTSDRYGGAIASIGDLNGDGVADLVVGAPLDEAGVSAAAGAIFIHFMNTDGSIDSSVKIGQGTTNGPSGLGPNDQYGTSVACIGDLDGDGVQDILVGAAVDEAGATSNVGAVFIHYLKTDGTIKSSVKIGEGTTNGPTGLAGNDSYGSSVASIGDLDGDGVQDIAVGALFDENGATSDTGAIWIHFMNTNGSIDSSVKIGEGTTNGPTGLEASDSYGSSLASIGDLNNDGVQDIAVGAYSDETGAQLNAGAIYIHFLNTNGTLVSTTKIGQGTTNGPTGFTSTILYGSALSSPGDMNNDDIPDLLVGARQYDNSAGGVFLHYLSTDGSIQSTVIFDDSTTNGATSITTDFYGASVASIGDLNGDRVPDIAVGAIDDEAGATSTTGTIFLHVLSVKTYSVSYSAGANGSLSGTANQTVAHTSDASSITAVPDDQYLFLEWSDSSTDNPRTDTNVTANIAVTASFTLDTDRDGIPNSSDTDDDNDTIPDTIENAGDNGGDINNDGILDSLQPEVASLPNTVDAQYVSLDLTGNCSTITSVETLTEDDFAQKDASYSYPLGLVDFSADCSAPGESANVTIYFIGDVDPNRVYGRKFNGSLHTDIVGAVQTGLTIGGQPAIQLTYTITDGGENDTDGLINGAIDDPVGVGTKDARGGPTFITPVANSLTIEAIPSCTAPISAHVTLSATNASEYIFSENMFFQDAEYAPLPGSPFTRDWTFTTFGEHTLYVQLKSPTGNSSFVLSTSVTLTPEGCTSSPEPSLPPENPPYWLELLTLEDPSPTPLPEGIAFHNLIKLPNDGDPTTQFDSAVYYIGADNRRHAFPNERTYFSWFCDFSEVREVELSTLALIPLGNNVPLHPGFLMKFTDSPAVYVVDAYGFLRHIPTEVIAKTLFGDEWAQLILDVPPVFYKNYRTGAPDLDAASPINLQDIRADFHWPSSILPLKTYIDPAAPTCSF